MGVVKLSTAGITNFQKYDDMLAGNLPLFGPAYELLETEILASNQSTVVFSNLISKYSSLYKHLQLRASVNCTTTASNQFLTFNGVTASGSYTWHYLSATGTQVISGNGFNTSGICWVICNADTNNFSGAIVDILDAFSSTKNKTVRSFYGSARSGSNWLDIETGIALSTAAINSIELGYGQTWLAGSRFSLYGLRSF